MAASIVSTLRYANANNKALEHEKAYILNYATPPGVPMSNFAIDMVPDIKIHDLRSSHLTYHENGITIARISDSMTKEDFDSEETVESCYLPEIHRCIQETLGAEEVYIFDYMIRKREPAFPFQEKTRDKAPQPALSAHIGKLPLLVSLISRYLLTVLTDYTPDEIDFRLDKYFKEKAEAFRQRKFQVLK